MPDFARPQIAISDESGRTVASAEIKEVDAALTRTSLHVEPGQLPPGSRAQLVDAVLDAPEVRSHSKVQVALPLGDTEMLDRVRERCDTSESHAAGSSCMVDADVPDTEPEPPTDR